MMIAQISLNNMSEKETPASLLLRDAKNNLQICTALAEHQSNDMLQHEVYFQACYAVEKAVKAVCDVYGIATVGQEKWNEEIKTHDLKVLFQILEENAALERVIETKIRDAVNKIRFHPDQKYPDLKSRTIPNESSYLTTELANEALTYAQQFVKEVDNWILTRTQDTQE